MNTTGIFLILPALILAVIYLVWFCHQKASWPKTIVKTGSVLLLAVCAMVMGPAALIAALCLCALGDYLLSRDTEATFLTGVAAFAAGHIAYVWLFLTHPLSDWAALSRPAALALVIALAVLGLIMARVLATRAGALKVPVLFYIPVILSMGLAALTLPALGPLALILPAALLFILSDFVLSLEMFVLPPDHKLRRYSPFVVWSTYWTANLGFLMGFAAPF